MWRQIWSSDDRGAAAVEFGIVASLLFFITFAVIEGAVAAWQWNAVEKAAQVGVRLAAVADPVASTLKDWNCGFVNGASVPGIRSGEPCLPNGATFATITCTGADTSCTDGTFDAVAYDAIRDRMRRAFAFVQDDNIVIEYRDSRLGYAGRPMGAIPEITVRLTGIPFNFIVLDAISMLPLTGTTQVPGQIMMPDITATMMGEDLDFEF
jgi:Flp pilus assembly pilin Flp